MEPIRVFIGYDSHETVAYHTLSQSILARASLPVSITPLALDQLKSVFLRERNPLQTTEFAFSRFLVPYLCGYKGWAIFMDCDMLVQRDIAELWAMRDERFAVQVAKHDYTPKTTAKFLNQAQTVYEKKNWSSVMLMNCARCEALTVDYVNTATGLELHRFRWLADEALIGEIPINWNFLVGEYAPIPEGEIANLHYTLGGPYFEEYKNTDYAHLWFAEEARMRYASREGIVGTQAIAPDALQTALIEAMKLHVAGNLAAAKAAYTEILKQAPDTPEAHGHLGIIALQQADAGQAESLLQQAVQRAPHAHRFALHLAQLLEAQGRWAEVAQVLNRPLDAGGLQEELLFKRTLAAAQLEDTRWLHDVLPKYVVQLVNAEAFFAKLVAALHEGGAYTKIAAMISAVLPILPEPSVQFLNDYAKIILNVTRDVVLYADLLNALRPRMNDMPKLTHDIGSYYAMVGEHKRALEFFDEALKLAPNMPEARFSKAQMQLMHSGFKEGLDLYDARFDLDTRNRAQVAAPRWKGEDLSGKHLFIWGEQGVGDMVMFASLLPALQQRFNPAKITLSVYAKMVALFQRSFPDMEVIAMPESFDDIAYPQINADVCMPMGEVLRYVLPHATPAKEQPQGFLKANAEEVRDLRMKLKSLGNKRLIGFSWMTTNDKTSIMRNIALKDWAPIFETPNCLFFSLQHFPDVQAIDKLRAEHGYNLMIDPNFDPAADVDKLASLVAAMDEIISIQNANIHLGGALAVPTTLMLSHGSDFRWLTERNDNLWYSSVHIERQKVPLQWGEVIERVASNLRHRAQKAA